MNEEAAVRLLDRIAETGLRPETWSELLVELSAFAGAKGAFLIPLNGDVAGLQVTESLDGLLEGYVRDGWSTNDYRFRGEAKMRRDGIVVDQDFIDADVIRHEPFYDTFLRSFGLRYFAGLAVTSGQVSYALTLQRGVAAEPFALEEQAWLRRLVAPLRDAVRIGRALRAAYATGRVDQLSEQDVACVLLDRGGRVAYLNAAAEGLFGKTVDVVHGRLRLKTKAHSDGLDRRIRIALAPPVLDGCAASEPLFLGHPTPNYLLRVTRLPHAADHLFQPYRAMVQIRPLFPKLELDTALVEKAFDLSPREGKALQALLRHQGVPEAARANGVSYETMRSQLKSIYAKTGISNQIALMSVVTNFMTRSSDRKA